MTEPLPRRPRCGVHLTCPPRSGPPRDWKLDIHGDAETLRVYGRRWSLGTTACRMRQPSATTPPRAKIGNRQRVRSLPVGCFRPAGYGVGCHCPIAILPPETQAKGRGAGVRRTLLRKVFVTRSPSHWQLRLAASGVPSSHIRGSTPDAFYTYSQASSLGRHDRSFRIRQRYD